jgi:hypothetical protein
MDIYLALANVFKDAGVGGRLASHVMVLWQTINRDGNPASPQTHPLFGDWNHRAGYYQGENPLLAKGRQQAAKLAVPNERLASYQRHMQWAMLRNQGENAGD